MVGIMNKRWKKVIFLWCMARDDQNPAFGKAQKVTPFMHKRKN